MGIKDNQLHYEMFTIPALDVDFRKSMTFTKDISANSTFTFSNVIVGKSIMVTLKNTGASAITVNFSDSNIIYPGVATSYTINAGKVTAFTFLPKSASEILISVLENPGSTVTPPTNLGKRLIRLSNATNAHSGYIDQDTNELYVWGVNTTYGNLGFGDAVNRSTPTKHAALYKDAAAGSAHMAFLDVNNDIWASGYGPDGTLANFGTSTTFIPVKTSTDVKFSKVDMGYTQLLGLSQNGKVYGAGLNTLGTLGDGSAVNATGFRALLNPIGLFTSSTALPVATKAFTLTKLSDGRVLMIAGNTSGGNVANTYFGTVSGNSISWVAGTALPTALERHATVKLADDRILVTGGITAGTGTCVNTTYFGVVSGNSITWTSGTNLPTAICSHTLNQLADGRILIVGGDTTGASVSTNQTQFGTISGDTITWAAGTVLGAATNAHNTILLNDNRLLMIGGWTTAVTTQTQFLTISGNTITYTAAGNALPIAQRYQHFVILPTQKIMLTGGFAASALDRCYFANAVGINGIVFGHIQNGAPLNPVVNPPRDLPVGTYHHQSVLLDDGRVLHAGGVTAGGTVANTYLETMSEPTYTDIIAGYDTSGALASDGSIHMFGYNNVGQLGNNTINNMALPVSVLGGRSYSKFSGTQYHTVAINGADGSAWAWGYNNAGQLGDNTIINKSSPVSVLGGHSYVKISTGTNMSGGIRGSDGAALMWGENTAGELGDGTTTNRLTPVPILTNFARSYTDISCGLDMTLLLEGNGTIWGMGANGGGQLGDDSVLNKSVPAIVVPGTPQTNVKLFSSNYYFITTHAGVLTNSGYVKSWGLGTSGQFGNCNTANSSYPHYACIPNRTIVDVKSGGDAMMMLTNTGEIWTCGHNGSGELGDSSITNRLFPVSVVGGRVFSAISMGISQSGAIQSSDGVVYMWGLGTTGQLGDNSILSKSSPVAVSGARSYSKLAVGEDRAMAIEAATGNIYAWGINANGSLGDNTITNRSVPTSVVGGRSYSEISCGGDDNAAAIEGSTGNIYCWGYNNVGQLGDGTVTSRSSPVSVLGGRSFSKVSCGDYHVLAIEGGTGLLYAWGLNDSGQLGDGTLINRSSPVAVMSNVSFTQIAAGNNSSLAMTSTGDLYAWGLNTSGELGDRTLTNIRIPKKIVHSR